jgi:2-hydroxychromene-2-carboxylate isomerase
MTASPSPEPGRTPLEFLFDFASGYAYFAALEIEALAERHARTVLGAPLRWAPLSRSPAPKASAERL